jgi:hypothetical protein
MQLTRLAETETGSFAILLIPHLSELGLMSDKRLSGFDFASTESRISRKG